MLKMASMSTFDDGDYTGVMLIWHLRWLYGLNIGSDGVKNPQTLNAPERPPRLSDSNP
jgi:hypothetical protein